MFLDEKSLLKIWLNPGLNLNSRNRALDYTHPDFKQIYYSKPSKMSIAKYWVPLNIPSNILVFLCKSYLFEYSEVLSIQNENVPFQISCVAPSWPNLRRDLIIKCLGDSSFNVRTQVSLHKF